MSCAGSPEDFPSYDHVLTSKPTGVVPKNLLESLAAMEVETVAPFIAPLLVALKDTVRAVQKAVLNEVEMGELLVHCTDITGNVIQKAHADSRAWTSRPCKSTSRN